MKNALLQIRCYKDGVELNGCNIAFTLYVY